MSEEKWVDPGHRLSDEDFAAVVRRAKEVREEVAAAAEGGAAGPGGIFVDMTAAGIRSKKYFPVSGIPTQLLVLHSAECPLQAGYAVSLTEWFQATVYPQAPVASWQRFVDPVHRVRAIPDELGAWHASEANVLSIGWEQAGYARYSTAEWLTPDGRAQLELLAFDMAEVAVRDGIPARWLSYEEVRAVLDGGNRTIKGFCVHRQVDPETRTDPGDNYPYELLMERVRAYMGGEPATTTEDEEDPFMTYSPDELARILAAADRINGTITEPHDKVLTTAHIPAIASAVLNTDVQWHGFDGNTPTEGRQTTTLATDLGWADSRAAGTNALVQGLQAQVKALAELAAAGTSAATKEEILAQLDKSVKDTLGDYTPVLVKNQELSE